MTCPTCGKNFAPRAKNQIYCSRKCERRAYNARYLNGDAKPDIPDALPIDEFICKNCGKVVFIYDRSDQRTVYCSGKCFVAYQKKRAAQRAARVRGNLGVSGGMCLGSLIRRERRDLD